MSKETPAWLAEAREFCRSSGIKIMAWGPDLLTVEAKSDDRAKQIASQLGQLGFKVIPSEDDGYAGMLSLSKNPSAIQTKTSSLDISRRRWVEQIVPLIWAFCSLLLIPGLSGRSTSRPLWWICLPVGIFSLVMFFRDGARIWGWRLELLPEELRVRRYYRWSTIPWIKIRAVETETRFNRGAAQVTVSLALVSAPPLRLGVFEGPFASRLRDRLREEIARRRRESK
jgi:hypothetical protein